MIGNTGSGKVLNNFEIEEQMKTERLKVQHMVAKT